MQGFRFKVPGKTMINGAYIVLHGDPCISVAIDTYLNVDVSVGAGSSSLIIQLGDKKYNFSREAAAWSGDNPHSDSNYILDIVNAVFDDSGRDFVIFGVF